jgi:hypothetical protein
MIMDKMGLFALILGVVLCIIGGYAIWAFFPEVLAAIKGLAGIVVLLVGLMIAVFGLLIIND